VEIAADADRAAAGAAGRVDDAAVVEQDALPFDRDAAAALARRPGRLASTVPDDATMPSPPPSMTIFPSRLPIDFAWTTPDMLSTVSAKAPRAAARISIEPPSAWIRPSCSSRFFASVALVWKKSRPSPSTSTETAFAATMPTRPAVGDDRAGVG
jgi:hypothetical protein